MNYIKDFLAWMGFATIVNYLQHIGVPFWVLAVAAVGCGAFYVGVTLHIEQRRRDKVFGPWNK